MKVFATLIVIITLSLSVAANDVSKLLESKPASGRADILTNFLHQSGYECGKATRTFLQGYDKDDAGYWNIACSNGQSYSVQVQADPSGKTRILECSIMKMIGAECFKKFSN